MPRRPTRSRGSDRTTRKDLSRRLDDVATEEDYGDLEPLDLAEAIANDLETVDEEAGVVRLDNGELRKNGNVQEELMAGLKDVYEDD